MKQHYLSRWLIAIGFLLACLPTFAQKRTLSGYVMDAASKETLIGATVVDKNSGKGCATNSYGFYTLTLDQGQVELQVSYVGYTQQNRSLDLKENLSLNFLLETNTTLEEVVVEGARATVSARSPQMSVVELPVQQIKSIPTLFGEADVLKKARRACTFAVVVPTRTCSCLMACPYITSTMRWAFSPSSTPMH